MTSSQEPPLTRREMRELERLREQQRAEAAEGQQAPAQPSAPTPPPPYPQQPRMPQPAASGAPQGGYAPAPGAPARGGQGGPPADRRRPDQRQAPPPRGAEGWGAGTQGAPQHYQNLPPAQRPQPGGQQRGATTSGSLPPQGQQRGPTTSGPLPPQGQQRGPTITGPLPPQGQQRGPTTTGPLPPHDQRGATSSGAMPPPAGPRPQPGVRTAAPQPAPSQSTTPERTLTRRELRAMLDAHSAEGFVEDDEVEEPQRAPGRGAAEQRPSPAQPQRPPHQPAPTRAAAPHTTVDAGLDEPVAAPKPVGHWTSQLNLPEDREEPYDQVLSRGGSARGAPTTTNALILPSLPDQGALGTPLAPTGEIMVTGSIDLPRSYGATGVHPSQIDSSEVDRLFDNVEDVAGTGVAPISATRAISTQGQNRSMMAPPSKEGMNVPLVLAVTAGVLALGVVATLVVGAVAGLF